MAPTGWAMGAIVHVQAKRSPLTRGVGIGHDGRVMASPGPIKTAAAGVLAITLIAVGWAGRATRDAGPLGVIPVSFLTAVASGDAEELEHHDDLVVDQSPAAAYVEIAARTVRAVVAAGVEMPSSVSVQPIDGGLRVCADAVACSTFTKFDLAGDGRVRSFVVDGVPVEQIVGGGGAEHGTDPTTTVADPTTTTEAPDGTTTTTEVVTVPTTPPSHPVIGIDPEAPGAGVTSTTAAAPTQSTAAPTTVPPTTAAPTTVAPTTVPPTTAAPTTLPPSTMAPGTSIVGGSSTTSSSTTTTRPPTTTATAPATTTTTAAPTTTTTPAPPMGPGAPTTRDLGAWPFSADSPWNVGVGSAAVFASSGDSRGQAIRAPQAPSSDHSTSYPIVTWINATSYSVPVYVASASDPLVELRTDWEGSKYARIPASAVPAQGTDSNMAIVQPDGTTWDVWTATWVVPGKVLKVGRAETTSLTGTGLGPQAGIRASGLSSIGGLIRRWEVDPTDPAYTDGVIRHAIALSLPSGMLRYDGGSPGYDGAGYGTASGYVWPATEQDYDSPWTYGGPVPMGTMVAIPRSVDVTKLGLGPEALALARALQDYGGFVVDRAGDGTVAFYAEPSVPSGWYTSITGPTWTGRQLTVLRQVLQVVANNTPGSVGGGGTRSVAAAPAPS
jgi:hypothetical protein